MTTALICLAPERSGFNGSLRLTDVLRRRGWRVVYMTSPDFRDYVAQQSLEFRVVGEDYEEETRAFVQSIHGTSGRSRLRLVRRFETERIERIVRDQSLLLDEVRPHVVLVDPLTTFWALAPMRRRIPLVELNPCFAWGVSGKSPPVFSDVAPVRERRALSEARGLLSWGWLWTRQFPEQMRGVLHGAATRKLVHAAGFRTRRFEFGYRLDVPEIVLGPRELDFPLASTHLRRRYYMGLGVAEYRVEGAFDLSRLDASKKLAYCTLGTFSSLYDARARLFNAAVEVFGARADWQLLLSVGDLDRAALGRLPTNVLVESMVPQCKVLERAQVFIHQGGMSSFREGVHYGVPMVIFPVKNDQHGQAARAVYHGLGVRGDIATVTTESLRRLVDHAVTSVTIAASIARVGNACRGSTDMDETIAFLDRYADPS